MSSLWTVRGGKGWDMSVTGDALAVRERRLRLVRSAGVLAAAGAITALVAGGLLFEEFGLGALLAAVGGLVALAGGVVLRGQLVRGVRYRIDRPYSSVWLAAKLVALLAMFGGAVAIATAVDAPSLPRPVIVVVVVGALSLVVATHAARWTLCQVDATGVKVGRASVTWPSVGQLDLAAAAPGTVEIGVRPAGGQPVNGTPAPGTVLVDVPVCTLVPAVAVDVDRIMWAVREFGNPAIPVVVRRRPWDGTPQPPAGAWTAPGEQTVPNMAPAGMGADRRAGRGRGAVIGGLSALVVVAAVVVVIVLEPWRSSPSSPLSSQSAGPNGKDGYHWSLTRADTGFFVGLWATPDSVVLGHWKGLTAYDVESGEELWSWQVPEGNHLCNMSQTTASFRGAFTYGPRGSQGEEECHTLQTVSLESGELGWEEPVSLVAEGSSGRLGKIGGASLSISTNLVSAPYAGRNSQDEHSTDLIWVDVRTGERVGSTDAGTEPVDLGCRLSGYAQAQQYSVVAVANCRDSSRLIRWDVDSRGWIPGGELTGCRELSHYMGSAYLWSSTEHWLVGCGSPALEHLHRVTPEGHGTAPVDLGHVAVEEVRSNGGGQAPENVVLDGDDVYLVRGTRGNSDGVVMTSDGQPWEYAVEGASEVRLMAAEDRAVTLLVTTPGPAALYTVAGPNEAKEGPKPAPEVADKLPGATQAVRVGDYLVCGFTAIEEKDTVIGVVRAAG